ncbi:MAG: pyridoxal phosphate-dependent aminotransferase [Alphaproteobacteria bacterium]|nr:pyridoxal phosphate-dependent aminotransferase [Alphaproteobacteria bacterium]
MGRIFTQRAINLSVSPTTEMAVKSRALQQAGYDVVDMSAGVPDFDTPDEIKDAASAALAAGYTKYSPIPGIPILREAIAAKLKRDNGLDYKPTEIVVSNGAKQSLANVCMAFLEPGDEAIIIGPCWPAYANMIEFAGAKSVFVPTQLENGFHIDINILANSVNSATKLIILNSPSNPSGVIYTREELEALIALIRKNPDIWILSDEIYNMILFGGVHVSPASLPYGFERTVIINGLSKAFSMTGWRVGYTAAPAPVAAILSKIQAVLTAGANSFVQHAAAFALNEMESASRMMRDSYLERRDMTVSLLRAIPKIKVHTPDATFYAFPDVSAYFGSEYNGIVIRDADDMATYLLDKGFVAIVSGVEFGTPNHIRLTFSISHDNIRKGIARIADMLEKLHRSRKEKQPCQKKVF